MPRHRRYLGASAQVPDMRPRRLLRRVAASACDEALRGDGASADPVARTRRALDVVLRRRSHDRPLITVLPESVPPTWTSNCTTHRTRLRTRPRRPPAAPSLP